MAQAVQQAEVAQLIPSLANEAFDLMTGPLLRMTVLQLNLEEHIMVIVAHHIVSDGWSMGIFQTELSASYQARLSGYELVIPRRPIHFADFAWWQRQSFQGQRLEKERNYWKSQLAGLVCFSSTA